MKKIEFGKCVITHVGINTRDPQRRRDLQKMVGNYLHRTGKVIQEESGQVNVFDDYDQWLFSWKAEKGSIINHERFGDLFKFESVEKEYDEEGEEIGSIFEIFVRHAV